MPQSEEVGSVPGRQVAIHPGLEPVDGTEAKESGRGIGQGHRVPGLRRAVAGLGPLVPRESSGQEVLDVDLSGGESRVSEVCFCIALVGRAVAFVGRTVPRCRGVVTQLSRRSRIAQVPFASL